jgi:serine phosphatase RsbU (regulator of sigma subunit)
VTTQQKSRQGFWQSLFGRDERHHDEPPNKEELPSPLLEEPPHNKNEQQQEALPDIHIAPNDPIVAYFASASGVVEIDKLDLDSPALLAMKSAEIKLVVPLVSQGELIGLLNLGPRLSQQEYSADDRKLLNDLATQTAPAVQVAQLVRQQQQQAQERERIEQELRVARLIQQTLLPKHVPELEGYQLAAYYQPAREVGGDFYDFLTLDEGHLGLVVGDVTDKGVPAALVMATTRTMLRASAQRLDSPGAVLQRVNDVIVSDIPPNMFITCLYAILEMETGRLRYANAGHDLPYRRRASSGGAEELRATGMPLGLLPGMSYEEKEIVLQRGESVLFYSDGLVEAHDPHYEMFGFPRLQGLVGAHRTGGEALVNFLLSELSRFTGEDWEQEDDITLVTLQRSEST